MSHEIHNPYVEEIDPDQHFLISRRSCWVVISLFLIFILAPPLYRNIHDSIKGDVYVPVIDIFKFERSKETPTIAHHLKAAEAKIDKAEFRGPPRRLIQTALTKFLGTGNQKTYVGRDGWLFLRAGIDALTGYGPLKPEPPSPMKDPTQVGWESGLPVITEFAAQLKERGIELLLIPVPVKPMIYPEQIDGKSHTSPLRHRDTDEFYSQLRAAGVDVLDLGDSLWNQKESGAQIFLKQDTHWTSDTMRMAARLVADHIKTKPYYSEIAAGKTFEEKTLTRTHTGDLAEKLDIPDSGLYQPETQEITMVVDPETGEPIADDPRSPIVLLGDSFVNIFDDPGIGFGAPGWKPEDHPDYDPQSDIRLSEPLIGAGFRRHLAKELGTPLDVIAVNGQGASGVRSEFANKPDNIVRAKKLVVWTLASRDLFLSETPAREAAVEWKRVKFSTAAVDLNVLPAGGFVATATLKEKSPITDPLSVPYKHSLFACLYEIKSVEESTYETTEIIVYQWAFQDRKMSPTSRFEIGKDYRLTLSPWASKTALQTINKTSKDEFELRFDLPDRFFVEKGVPAP